MMVTADIWMQNTGNCCKKTADLWNMNCMEDWESFSKFVYNLDNSVNIYIFWAQFCLEHGHDLPSSN
jgi:hypothetical protein